MHFIHRNTGLISIALLILAGCATTPETAERDEEITPEAGWAALTPESEIGASEDDARERADWLKTFGDNRLVALVEEALEQNYDLRAFAQSVESTRALAKIAGADRLPQAGVGLDASRSQTVIEGSGDPATVRSDQGSLGLNVSWEVDVWGRLKDRTEAALADVEAAEADLTAARLSLSGQIAKAWFRTSSARQLLSLAEETVRSFDATANLVRDRFETGVSTSLELRLALANQAAGHALRHQRTQELDAANRALETLLGRYPANRIPTVDTLPMIPLDVPAGLPSELLHRRPDIVAAERRLAAADARVGEATKALLPSLRLTGSAGTASTDLENLLDADFSVWSIAAGLAQPIFQGGRLRANVDLSKSEAERNHANYLSTILTAFQEVETRLAAESTLRQREINLADAAEHSDGAERLARDEYEAGLADIFSVLESQRRALDARSAYIRIREERLNNRVDLHLSLGGGFEASAESTVSSIASDPANIAQTR